MNFGPIEFANYLRLRDEGQRESATVRAARAAAATPRPARNRLTVVSGPRELRRRARDASGPVSVREALASGNLARPVRVRVKPALRALVLVLSSHHATAWQLEVDPGATLSAVLVAGAGESRVSGAGNAPVISIGGFYAFKPGSFEFRHLEDEVLRCTGRSIGSFRSLRPATDFDIAAD